MRLNKVVGVTIAVIILTSFSFSYAQDSASRIYKAYQQKEISYEESLILQLKAVMRPDELPTKFKVIAVSKQVKHLTPVLFEIRANWKNFTEAQKQYLTPFFERPTSVNSAYGYYTGADLKYETTHYVIHYTQGNCQVCNVPGSCGQNPIYSTRDCTPLSTGFVTFMGTTFEDVYSKEVTQLGYNSPPSDGTLGGNSKFDVYILNFNGLGLYGAVVPEDTSGKENNCTTAPCQSFMVMDSTYAWALGPQKVSCTNIVYNTYNDYTKPIQVTAAHEFFHTVQKYYNSYHDWWNEASSTWMEDIVYPGVNDNMQYLCAWYADPSVSLDKWDSSTGHQYGSWIWYYTLVKLANGDKNVVKKIYENLVGVDLSSGGSAAIASIYTKMDSAIKTYTNNSYDLSKAFIYFTAKNAQVSFYDSAENGNKGTKYFPINNLGVSGGAAIFNIGTSSPVSRSYSINHMSAHYISFQPTDTSTDKYLKINFTGPAGKSFGATVIKGTSTTNLTEESIILNNSQGMKYISGFGQSNSFAILVVSNATTDSDNQIYSFTATVETTGPQSASAPTQVSATAGNAQTALTWTAATAGTYSISGYNIYRSTASGSGYSKVNSSVATSTTFTDTGLTNGTTYYYVVRAADLYSTESANSSEVSATPFAAPSVPANLSATTGNTQISLSWTAATQGTYAISGYNVYRSTTPGGGYAKINTTTVSATNYSDAAVTNGTKYYYVVRAVDAQNNESSNSSEVNATPFAAPSAPTNLSTNTTTTVILSWTAAVKTTYDIASYNVYRSTTPGSGYKKINTLTATTYKETTATTNNTYYYVVRAVDAQNNESASSNEVSATVFAFTFPQGVSMVSIPLSLSETAASVFGSDILFARWEQASNAYDLSSSMNLKAGNGYWLKLSSDKTLNLLGAFLIASTTTQPVDIKPGWNQIANPFTADYVWENVSVTSSGETKTLRDAVTADWVGSYAWSYFSNQSPKYQCVNYKDAACAASLKPFYGYWIYSKVNGTLNFSKSKLDVPPAKLAENVNDTLFSVQIKASTATSSDDNNVLGVSKGRGSDDALKPPNSPEDNLRAYFVSGNKQKAFDYHTGASQKEQVWDFVVECDGTQNVTLSWDANALPLNAKLFIQDTATGGVTDMTAQKSASVSVSGKKAFKIKYYKPDVLTQNNGGVSLFVTRPFMYPNPDKTGNATFRYLTSPQVVRVSIEVYSLAGKLLDKFDGNLNGESKWLFGDKVAAGVYFYRITAYTTDGKESVVGKIVVVR